jgi:hypothetical protein
VSDMLQVTVPATEQFNEITNEFVTTKAQTLQLEHSLISLSKWESKWNKAFLSNRVEKTTEEMIDYVRCMTITPNVNPDIYYCLSHENVAAVNAYIEAPMTATVFGPDVEKTAQKETITSELIYYWMIANNIPFECQKWHLNRLITLIRVCSIKNTPPKKVGKREIMNRNAALNAARRKKMNSKG